MSALTESGLVSSIAELREARKHMALRHRDAVQRMAEAEVDAHQLGRVVTATDHVIETYEAALRAMRDQAAG